MEDLSRRTMMVSGAMLAAAPAMPAMALGAAPQPVKGGMQFDDPQHNLDAVIRLRGGTDDVPRFSYGVGRAFAVFKDEIAVPLFDAKAVQWERNKRQDDGSYIRQTAFVQYHYDLGGGSPDSWTNPVTGKTIKLPVFKNEFGEARFTTRGTVTPPPEMKVKTQEGDKERIYPWVTLGDDVWLPKEEMASYFSQREQKQLIENSVRTYQTSLRELNDLSNPSVSSRMVESAQSTLFSFLEMPEEKGGYMMWRFIAKKVGSPENLPDDIRRQVDAENPEIWNTEPKPKA